MKYTLGAILGAVAGFAVAVMLLYLNPFTRQQSVATSDSDWVLEYSLASGHTWLSTHATGIGLPMVPEGVQTPYERGIKGAVVTAMPLNDVTNGATAAATRISIPSARSEFLRAGLLVEDYWLISVPGEGSVLVHAENNQWPLLRDTIVRVDWLQRDWTGPGQYSPTRGPENRAAEVHGLSGEYAGAFGSARERLTLDDYDGTLSQLAGALMLDVSQAQL